MSGVHLEASHGAKVARNVVNSMPPEAGDVHSIALISPPPSSESALGRLFLHPRHRHRSHLATAALRHRDQPVPFLSS